MTQKIDKEKKWELKIAFISAIVAGSISLASTGLTLYFSSYQKKRMRLESF